MNENVFVGRNHCLLLHVCCEVQWEYLSLSKVLNPCSFSTVLSGSVFEGLAMWLWFIPAAVGILHRNGSGIINSNAVLGKEYALHLRALLLTSNRLSF